MKSARNQLILLCFGFATLLSIAIWTASTSIVRAQTQQSTNSTPLTHINSSILGSPLVPTDPSGIDEVETAALASIFNDAQSALNSLDRFTPAYVSGRREIESATVSELEDFLSARPQSVWAPSVRNRIGSYYMVHGGTTKAITHFETAWHATRVLDTPQAKREAHIAFAHWTRLLVIYGRTDTLAGVFDQYGTRSLDIGPFSQHLARTHEKYVRMLRYPEGSYKCGIFAMDQVANRLKLQYSRAALVEVPSKVQGFNMQELEEISTSFGLGLVPVRRSQNSTDLPVPSVVHLQQEHYAAILEERDGLFLVNDPGASGLLFLTADEINAEATGFFMVPQNLVQGDFRRATSQEASAVVGRVSSCPPDEFEDKPCDDSGNGNGGNGSGSVGIGIGKGGGSSSASVSADRSGEPQECTSGCNGSGGGCCEPDLQGGWPGETPGHLGEPVEMIGMATWKISEPYLDLWVNDTPVLYTPSKGPSVRLDLHYKQRYDSYELYQYGAGWRTAWDTRIRLLAFDFADLHTPGGGVVTFDFPSGSNVSQPIYLNNWVVERFVNGSGVVTGVVARLPSGSEYRYYQQVDSTFLLSERVDPSGNKLVFAYDSGSPTRIVSVTDADGGTTSLSYTTNNSPFTHYEVAVTTPDSRTATLYVSTNSLLYKVTDTVGITSSFTYGAWGWMDTMTTPYGTNTFTHDYVGWVDRTVFVGLPGGGTEAWALLDEAPTNQVPNSFLSSQIPTNTPYAAGTNIYGTLDTTHRNMRNTFHWNAQQYASCSTNSIADMVWADFKKGRMQHWLQKITDISVNHTGPSLALIQEPSPDGTTEGQITWFDHSGKTSDGLQGTQVIPTVVARVQPDGSTWWQWSQLNSIGKPTNVIEKWEQNGVAYYRTNAYTYATNGIDVVEHRFKASGINELVAGYGYNANHQVTSMTNALNEVSTGTYDGSKRMVTSQSVAGMVSSNTFGGDGYVSKTVIYESGGSPVSTNDYTWSGGNLRTHTDPRGLKTTNTWDNLNRLTKVEFPDGSFIKHAYTNGSGAMLLHRTYTRDRMTNETRWTYTANQQVENIIDSLGNTNHYEYCQCGALESVTTAYMTSLAEITDYFYDNQMRVTEVDFPDGSWKTNAYDSLGRVTVTGNPLGQSSNTFDNLSRLVTSTNAYGQTFKAVYDAEGNVTSRTDANGVTVTSTYDDLHRLRTRTFPDSAVEAFGYTATVSGSTSYTNQLSKVTTYAYDKLGRKTNEVVVGLSTNSFTFAPASDLLTLSDGKSQVTTWGYDSYGRVASKKYANNSTNLTYGYDASSRLTNRWSSAFGNTQYKYDAVGNLTNINYPTSPDVTFKYDAHHRSTNEVVAGTYTNIFTYHPGGALASEDGPWPSDTVTYTHNTAGLRNGMTIQQPTGSYTNGYLYDAAKRLTNLTAHSGTFVYDYYPTNGGVTASTHLLRKLTLPPASYITNSFDNSARALRTRLFTSANAELNDHEYVYNAGNQRTKQTRTDDSHVNYTYDDSGQLRTAYTTNSSGSEITAQRYMYGYDAAWNMVKRTNNTTVSTYTVNPLNQITNLCYFDSNGNRSSDSTYTYAYDDENRLIRAEVGESWKREFTYDARGRLRAQMNYDWFGEWTLTDEIRFIYDDMLIIQERLSSNTPVVTYTRGPDLSGTIAGAGGVGGLLARSSSYQSGSGAWTNNLYYHADANGNVTYLMLTNQTAAATYRYDPFGRTISSSGTYASANSMRFSSKRIDTALGFYYYGYRFYDPNTQRWMNRDPIGDKGFLLASVSRKPFFARDNLYGFCKNTPVSMIDPLGLSPCTDQCLDDLDDNLTDTLKCQNRAGIGFGLAGAIIGGAIGGPPGAGVIGGINGGAAWIGTGVIGTGLSTAAYLACLAGCLSEEGAPAPPPGYDFGGGW